MKRSCLLLLTLLLVGLVFTFGSSEVFAACGDANGDGRVNISDAVYLIVYIFADGPEPSQFGDANCDSIINISDAAYLIAYIFRSGPAPCAACK